MQINIDLCINRLMLNLNKEGFCQPDQMSDEINQREKSDNSGTV
mgnify:CR=1 FL=1